MTSPNSVDAPPEPTERPHRPRIGEVNVLETFVGRRGAGKSTFQAWRARELQCDYGGAYVIGHSLGQRLPESIPPDLTGGNALKLPIVYHKTIEKLDKGLHSKPGSWHILAPPLSHERPDRAQDTEGADDLLRYSLKLSSAVRRQAWRRENPIGIWGDGKRTLGLEAPPIIVIIDEGIAVEAASTGGKSRGADKWFLEYLYSLRHEHIALLYAIQEPTARSWRVLEQSNAIWAFNLRHRWALQALEAGGASREQIEEIRALRPYEKVHLDGGAMRDPGKERVPVSNRVPPPDVDD